MFYVVNDPRKPQVDYAMTTKGTFRFFNRMPTERVSSYLNRLKCQNKPWFWIFRPVGEPYLSVEQMLFVTEGKSPYCTIDRNPISLCWDTHISIVDHKGFGYESAWMEDYSNQTLYPERAQSVLSFYKRPFHPQAKLKVLVCLQTNPGEPLRDARSSTEDFIDRCLKICRGHHVSVKNHPYREWTKPLPDGWQFVATHQRTYNQEMLQVYSKFDVVFCQTSISGFEAILTGRPAVTGGRTFYEDWGWSKKIENIENLDWVYEWKQPTDIVQGISVFVDPDRIIATHKYVDILTAPGSIDEVPQILSSKTEVNLFRRDDEPIEKPEDDPPFFRRDDEPIEKPEDDPPFYRRDDEPIEKPEDDPPFYRRDDEPIEDTPHPFRMSETSIEEFEENPFPFRVCETSIEEFEENPFPFRVCEEDGVIPFWRRFENSLSEECTEELALRMP